MESSESFLVVDDDEIFVQVLVRSLERRNKTVWAAHSITEAMNVAQLNKPTHAVIDLKIDQESGLQLTQQLKVELPDINIVILTGFSSISTAVEAIKLGATNYLCKPAEVDDIFAAFSATQGDTKIEIAATPPSVDRLEWEHIQTVLQRNNGNISATARDLGMHRRTLQRKLQKRPVKK